MPQPPANVALEPKSQDTREQRAAAWLDLMTASEELLLAGLRRKLGPTGDIAAAYRQWYADQMEEHARMLQKMCDEFNRRVS